MNEKNPNWKNAILPAKASILEAIKTLDNVSFKLVICTDSSDKLIGTLSDGDLRRGLIRGFSMESSINKLININPLVVPPGTDRNAVLEIMRANKVFQVPVVDKERKVIGLHLWDKIEQPLTHDHIMVIMAGGKGLRLRPFTERTPKPMIPINDKPILHHIIDRAKSQGFKRFVISLNYLGDIIRNYFGDGDSLGIQISYLEESEPLGTAGALSLLKDYPENDFVVTNGDVLTEIDYLKVIHFGLHHEAEAIMAVRFHEMQNPFGVVTADGVDILGFEEKPFTRSQINAGIYALKPSVLKHLVPNEHCDMPELFDRLRISGCRTVAFPMHESWLDVGCPQDLQLAKEEVNNRTE